VQIATGTDLVSSYGKTGVWIQGRSRIFLLKLSTRLVPTNQDSFLISHFLDLYTRPKAFRLCPSGAAFIIVSFASLITLIYFEYGLATKSDEIVIRSFKALLSQGEAMKVTLQAEDPTSIWVNRNNYSFVILLHSRHSDQNLSL
jgi:hypothetical protein